MTDDPLAALHPTPGDHAAALRIVLAMLSSDTDGVATVLRETQHGADTARMLLAACEETLMLLKKCTDIDPFHVVRDRIAHFLGEADDGGQ